MLGELFGESGAAALAIVGLELAFLVRLWWRARRRAATSELVADAVRLGLGQGRKRVRLGA